jgi:hypothetical protein
MKEATIFMFRTCITILVASVSVSAQFTYTIDQSIPVEVSGKILANPWAGGLNSAQFNTMDLDGDGKNDLVVFDRSSGSLSTFLQVDNAYRNAPDYAGLFPTGITHWMLLRDFNCDGKKDLFTSDPFGISVFVNTTPSGGQLSWRQFNNGLPLLTIGFSGSINLKVNESDLPAIDDVDGDGDLDVLNVRFVGTGTVEWHRNMSIETAGKCDSMRFQRVTQTYGNFEECSCGVFAFGSAGCPASGGRVAHVGGKNMLTLDLDNDGDRELLFAEESCARVYALTNTGTATAPAYTAVGSFQFSTTNVPLFPAPYYEDVDFDGKSDLIISPNVYGRTFVNWLVNNSVYLFRNTGTTQAPVFTFMKANFMQEEMIELGDYSVPTFGDFDNDGDEDMFIGFYAQQNFVGGIQAFENTGTRTLPSFRLFNPDYFGLSALFAYNFKPQIVDMNGDGRVDVAYTATSRQNGVTSLQYLRNDAGSGISFTSSSWVDTGFRIGVTENLHIVDINLDGKKDFLIGKSSGALEYWENTDPNGGYGAMVRKTSAYLGVTTSTSRLNPVVSVGDLDADGLEDLLLGTHRGLLSVYSDFRNFDISQSDPVESIIQNNLTNTTISINLGGRVWPAIVNLFDSDKPAIVVGNTTGGLQVLKNTEASELPEDPEITVFPNPLSQGDTLKVITDRPATMEVFSTLGQRLSDTMFIPANRHHGIPIQGLSSGLYIARFTIKDKYYSRRFIIY